MNETYIIASHILSPLGNGTKANWQAIREGHSGVALHQRKAFRSQPLCAALFTEEQWTEIDQHISADLTLFEKLLALSIQAALAATSVRLQDKRTLLLLASTKGNIGLLKTDTAAPAEMVGLDVSARKIAAWLNYHGLPIVVSNACISGMTALLTAKRLMDAGIYDHAVVAGADCISPFIVAGFRSFQALSDEVCKPFDQHRKGINLGEGAATIILSNTPAAIRLSGGSSSSDANHISGPSRTGAEMAQAIGAALQKAGITPQQVGGISAHGTATPFNDEMESKAFMLSGLEQAPAFSLKAHFGHTLGAAGLLESAIAIEALREGMVPASTGYKDHGVSEPVKIASQWMADSGLQHVVKTGSGFGGCNAALVFSKSN
nr:beta-ketoacyl synthase N-terminal-like domain-containing protein [Flavihumibacter fluvii]